jgi:hypothetical protein
LSATINQNKAARLERIFLRYESRVVLSSNHAIYKNLFRDHVAQQLLGSNWSGDTPIAVNADVNCLFHALSVALYGHQKASSEIKLKTCMEMVEHAMFYQRAHSNTLIPDISPTFADASRHCAQLTSFPCSWTMHAASTVICRTIKDQYIQILNTVFKPNGSRSQDEITTGIMWSTISVFFIGSFILETMALCSSS